MKLSRNEDEKSPLIVVTGQLLLFGHAPIKRPTTAVLLRIVSIDCSIAGFHVDIRLEWAQGPCRLERSTIAIADVHFDMSRLLLNVSMAASYWL